MCRICYTKDAGALRVLTRVSAAVLAAYGWPPAIDGADILSRLLALNLQRKPA